MPIGGIQAKGYNCSSARFPDIWVLNRKVLESSQGSLIGTFDRALPNAGLSAIDPKALNRRLIFWGIEDSASGSTMTITFHAICSLLQSIEDITAKQSREPLKHDKDKARDIIAKWFLDQRDALDDPATNGGAVLSVLFPHRRKDRVYGLQPPLLAKTLSHLLAFNHGQRALFDGWKTGTHGDLGVYIERAMKPWDGTFSSKQHLSVDQVDRVLVQLAAKYRFSDEQIRQRRDLDFKSDTEMKHIFVRLESWEAKWLVRLLLRDYCTIQLDELFVMQRYHFLLPELLMFQNDFDAAFDILRGELSCYPAAPEPAEANAMRIEAAKKLRARVGVKMGRPSYYKAWSFQNCIQLVGSRAWAAEVKYDGEYCEIHVDLEKGKNSLRIFSKNGKDATADRHAIDGTIRNALRIGQPDALFKRNCIVLGEMVVYSDEDRKILPFSKIRKHVTRSGSFIGTMQDSRPHKWEHLMIVFFDVLTLDDEPILRHCLQDRRKILRKLVRVIPGRSMRSEWTLLDFKTGSGLTDLKQTFARNLADRQEGLVLKPLYTPYLPLLTGDGHRQASFFIKLKKDYLCDMGGQRDLGDFVVIGASFDAQVAAKVNLKPLHWTNFHLGCCINKDEVMRTGIRPRFNVVASLCLNTSIPKSDARYLNVQGYIRQATLREDGWTDEFEISNFGDCTPRMSVAFRKPFVAEILGGGFETPQNASFEMLRHPRIRKIHHDRTWEDAVTMQDLERMAEEKFEIPDAQNLDGHARDIALLVKKYVREMNGSQVTATTDETTQKTTQRSSSLPLPETPQRKEGRFQASSVSEALCSSDENEDEGSEVNRLRPNTPKPTSTSSTILAPSTPITRASEDASAAVSDSKAPSVVPAKIKRQSFIGVISPPQSKRRRALCPLQAPNGERQQEKSTESRESTINNYANEGPSIQAPTHPDKH
ncbi:uncharacterized protein SETTUDRAFT_21563 [Exserohilum turcica Et28A]|uniref:ATP-dependent DNA ligase family profile domain-containing protein n=1 Tax=Exserohilum turcicum (strain 28A) TaxID=671987 RepID=R0IG55_EXST2|nr:uncharacterized protein SETTUDRAFT_21563 [Exserohilum turcica Et28A]EOA84205.1 hypothetical protein SETTUDRAFT_21563 [Exserohilum turcica Et28A]